MRKIKFCFIKVLFHYTTCIRISMQFAYLYKITSVRCLYCFRKSSDDSLNDAKH